MTSANLVHIGIFKCSIIHKCVVCFKTKQKSQRILTINLVWKICNPWNRTRTGGWGGVGASIKGGSFAY